MTAEFSSFDLTIEEIKRILDEHQRNPRPLVICIDSMDILHPIEECPPRELTHIVDDS